VENLFTFDFVIVMCLVVTVRQVAVIVLVWKSTDSTLHVIVRDITSTSEFEFIEAHSNLPPSKPYNSRPPAA
jgi:hypothetical protein